MRSLVTYFSASNVTAEVARTLAEAVGADLFEIKPQKPYTRADLNYINPLARCNREKMGRKDVAVEGRVEDFDNYDIVFIGFPIWYGCAPGVVNTFAGDYDWTGKKVGIFATSGGSGIGRTVEKLTPYIEGAEVIDAGVNIGTDAGTLKNWADRIIAAGMQNLESWAEALDQ